MDETDILAALRSHWENETTDIDKSHELYHDDAVLEFPQSRERFIGKANFLAWRKNLSGFPGVQDQADSRPGEPVGSGEPYPV